jgi:hypothetical protein
LARARRAAVASLGRLRPLEVLGIRPQRRLRRLVGGLRALALLLLRLHARHLLLELGVVLGVLAAARSFALGQKRLAEI